MRPPSRIEWRSSWPKSLRRLTTWAEELGLNDAVSLLQETLNEEKATDEALTRIAESVVNQEAEAA
jgi:ferritin-like metal-binding protein YciE